MPLVKTLRISEDHQIDKLPGAVDEIKRHESKQELKRLLVFKLIIEHKISLDALHKLAHSKHTLKSLDAITLMRPLELDESNLERHSDLFKLLIIRLGGTDLSFKSEDPDLLAQLEHKLRWTRMNREQRDSGLQSVRYYRSVIIIYSCLYLYLTGSHAWSNGIYNLMFGMKTFFLAVPLVFPICWHEDDRAVADDRKFLLDVTEKDIDLSQEKNIHVKEHKLSLRAKKQAAPELEQERVSDNRHSHFASNSANTSSTAADNEAALSPAPST